MTSLLISHVIRSEIIDLEIAIRALRSLHRVFTRSNLAAQRAIQQYLASRPIKHLTRVVSQIVHRLSRVMYAESQCSPCFLRL
jgi:hypothetical protein